jgi:hypothetical protein
MRTIDVQNVKGNFFGGLPYNVSWDFGVGAEPSKLTINIVSERGEYATPTPSFALLETLNIGDFKFEGYLVNYSFDNRPEQKTLQVEYLDRAADLNRYFVALHKKHGDKNKPSPNDKNLILVGKEYHPCDKNLDSKINYEESQETTIDYCDPCPYMPENKYDFSCDRVLSEFEIFPVYYTFNELISKISVFQIDQGDLKLDGYNKYKASHVGVLKNVLDSWCSDLGLAYFWDPFDKKLIFISRNKPLLLPTPEQMKENINVIDLNYGESIENTFSRGAIGSFEKAGSIQEYQCTNTTRENLKCFTLSDLYEEDKKNPYRSSEEENKLWSDIKELTVAVSYLGQSARIAFLWFWVFGNLNPELVEEMIIKNDSEKTPEEKKSDQNDENKIMIPLGNMKIKAVYSAQSTDEDNRGKWRRCQRALSQIERRRLDREDGASANFSSDNPSYYFFVAEVNEDLATKQGEEDENLAKNFLGKYWFKKFRVKIPGATNSNSQVQVESPEGEGSAQWYPVDSDLTTLPLFGFEYEEKSVIGKLVKDIDKEKKQNEEEAQKNREAARRFEHSKESLRNYNSFILMERNSKWFVPPGSPDSLKWYDGLFEWFKDRSPQVFGDNDGRPKFLERLYPESRKNSNIKLFICRALPSFDVGFRVVNEHPLEPKERKQKEADDQDVLGNTVIRKLGSWGLNGNKAVEITLPSPKGIKLTCPVQAFGNNQFITKRETPSSDPNNPSPDSVITGGGDVDGDEGFIVFVNSSATFPKVLPKIQYDYVLSPGSTQVAKVDYLLKSVEEDNLSLLNNKQCLISKKVFSDYAKDFFEYSKYEITEPQRKISFRMAGAFPETYPVSQGLSSVNISIDDNGVYTNYSFEDRVITPPSDEYIETYLRDLYTQKPSIAYLNPVDKIRVERIRTAERSLRTTNAN